MEPRFDPESAALRRRRRLLTLSLAGLALFLAWQALVMRSLSVTETRPPRPDPSVHLEIALDYQERLQEGRLPSFWRLAPEPGLPAFPPLYHLALAKFYGHGDSPARALWANWFYYALLCVSVFFIVWHFRGDASALPAAIAFACAPAIQELLLTQLVDLSVIALAAAAYVALLESERFQGWAASIAFGLLFAAGMLHKWTFFSYMIPAYYVGINALARKGSRWPALTALALGLGLCAPWYAAHAALVVPRLIEASAEASVPVWKGGAILTYLWQSVDGLGPAFWIAAWLGLLIPQYRRNVAQGWIVPAAVLASYLFWSIVPNRQLRFLLPGLPMLAVAFANAWPGPLVWGIAAVQLFGAANYTRGWIDGMPLPLPLVSAQLWPSDPPAREDWRVDELLRSVEAACDPDLPVANVTVVSEHPRFSSAMFSYRRKALKLARARTREVEKRPFEFSQFVIVKSEKLGASERLDARLKSASALVRKPNSWFARAFEKRAQWVLPDRSEVWLYGARKPAAPPLKAKGPVKFQYYNVGEFSATELKVELGRWDAGKSVYETVRAEAAELEMRGLRVKRLKVELDDALLASAESKKDVEWDEVRFLKIKRLRLASLSVEAADLKRYLETRVLGLSLRSLELDGTIRAAGTYSGLSFALELLPVVGADEILLKPVSVSFGRTRLAPSMIARAKQLRLPLTPSPETPFWIELPGLTIKGGRLSVP